MPLKTQSGSTARQRVIAKLRDVKGGASYIYAGKDLSLTFTAAEEERLDTLGRPRHDNYQQILGTGSVTFFSDESDNREPEVNDIFNADDVALNGGNFDGTVAAASTILESALIVTAVANGRFGNDISIELVDPAANNSALDVAFDYSSLKISVSLATDGVGTLTSTYAQIKAALEAIGYVTKLVSFSYEGGETGTTVAGAVSEVNLSGGAGRQMIVTSVNPSNDGALDVKAYAVNFKELVRPIASLHSYSE